MTSLHCRLPKNFYAKGYNNDQIKNKSKPIIIDIKLRRMLLRVM